MLPTRPDIQQYIAFLRRELNESDTAVESAPIVVWCDLLLKCAIRRGTTSVRLVPADDDSLRVFLGPDELPPASWSGSALSRFFVLAGLEKGEEARSRPQTSSKELEVGGRRFSVVARTVPLRAWREEIHLEIRP